MIPVLLTLKGIYSYQKQQTIDFTSLTANHLFGIFGPVGSGKSTILEAITFALYGETERLNSRDNRNYNMLNLKSSELLIDFIFKAGNYDSELFRFTVKGARDKTSFETTKSFERRAFKRENNTWQPIADKTADKIIGLSYENFRRTIIIPQGKFQEFLELGDSERTRMLKEIFNLDKYDLFAKTDVIDKKNTATLEGVKGQLLQIGEVNEQMIKEESEKLKTLSAERKKIETILQEQQTIETEMLNLKNIQFRIDQQHEIVNKLEQQAPHYQQRNDLLEKYEICQKYFPDLIKQKKETEEAITSAMKRIEITQNKINNITLTIKKREEEFLLIKNQYESRHDLEVQWKELESVRTILRLDAESTNIKSNAALLEKNLQRLNSIIDKLRAEGKSIDQSLKELKASLLDDALLMEIKRWFDRYSTLQKSMEELQLESKGEAANIEELEEQKNEILDAGILSKYLKPPEKKRTIGDIVGLVKDAINDCRKVLRAKEHDIESLKDTEVLETFASQLKEGEPCPLCGAEHHPHVYAGKGVKSRINQLTREKNKLEDDIEKLQASIQDLNKLIGQSDSAQESLSKTLKELNSKKKEIEVHKQQFNWQGYSISDENRIDLEIKQLQGVKEQIKQIESRKAALEQELNDAVMERDAVKEELQLENQRLSEIKGKRKALVDQIQVIDLDSLANRTDKSLDKEISILKKQFSDIEKQYEELERELQTSKEQVSNMRGTLYTEEGALVKVRAQLKRINGDLTGRMQSTGYKDLKSIEEILSSKLDIRSEKQAIQSYREKLHAAKEQLTKLEQEQGKRVYDEVKHRQVINRIGQLKTNLKEIDETIGKIVNRIESLRVHLKRKAELESQKQVFEARAENLTLLKRLFRGSKFVNYVSRVYLENLCGIANQRFAQLTRQKLRLELREDNSFQVRDFLNDGKVRSVKTLSGGQKFQASLSLALALANNVQQLARTEQSFFFLDEGFGSLDKESLAIAFETLKALRKENRIVGIISHVEELKQEIDNCVTVSLDEQEGSIIING